MPFTVNYNWEKPTVGGNTGVWGTILNTLFDAADASLKAVQDIATAALPKAGGTMTGALNVKTATTSRVDLGAKSGATAFDLTLGEYFTLQTTGNTTWAFNSPAAGAVAQGFFVRVQNGGAHVITFPPSVDWAGGTPPALTVAGIDVLAFTTHDNGSTWVGSVVAKDAK